MSSPSSHLIHQIDSLYTTLISKFPILHPQPLPKKKSQKLVSTDVLLKNKTSLDNPTPEFQHYIFEIDTVFHPKILSKINANQCSICKIRGKCSQKSVSIHHAIDQRFSSSGDHLLWFRPSYHLSGLEFYLVSIQYLCSACALINDLPNCINYFCNPNPLFKYRSFLCRHFAHITRSKLKEPTPIHSSQEFTVEELSQIHVAISLSWAIYSQIDPKSMSIHIPIVFFSSFQTPVVELLHPEKQINVEDLGSEQKYSVSILLQHAPSNRLICLKSLLKLDSLQQKRIKSSN